MFSRAYFVQSRYVTTCERTMIRARALARAGLAVCAPADGLRWPVSLDRQEVVRAAPHRRSPDMRTVAPHAQPQGAFAA